MDKFIGIELNSQSVKYVSLTRDQDRWHLQSSGIGSLDAAKPEACEVIRNLRNSGWDSGFLDTRIVSSISSKYLLVKEFVFPRMSRKELRESLKWKISEFLAFPVEQAVIDLRISEQTVNGQPSLRVLAVAIPREEVLRHIRVLQSLGLMPSRVTIAPLVFENLIRPSVGALKESEGLALATLNIRSETADLSIYKNGKSVFTRIIASKADRLFSEVRRSLDYFHAENQYVALEKMMVFGDQADLGELPRLLAEQLSLQVEVLDPLKLSTVSYDAKQVPLNAGVISRHQLSVPLGCALEGSKGIDLMPEQIAKERTYYLLSAGMRLSAILGSFIFLIAYLNLQFIVQGYKVRLEAAKGELETAVTLMKAKEPLESLAEEVANYAGVIRPLLNRRNIWSEILVELSQALPDSMTLSGLNVNGTDVAMQGYIIDAKQSPEGILSNFILSLEGKVFRDVTLVSARNSEEEGKLEFSLNSRLDY